MFDFCRSCGSHEIKIAELDEHGNKKWLCLDCGTQWNEIEYEQTQDNSEFVTGDLKDGSSIIYNKN